MTKVEEAVSKDYYVILQVAPNACSEVIQASYYALADLHEAGGEEEPDVPFELIKEAFKVLGNQSRKEAYDKSRKNLGGKIIGDYRVLEMIKEGVTGEYYLGEHIFLRKPVCLKHCSILSPTAQSLLHNEAEVLWDLRHYSLPQIKNIIRLEDGTSVLVMSYFAGPIWSEMIEKNGAMQPEHVVWLAQRIFNALYYIHSHSLIHGNINPYEIVVFPDRVMAALIGFGYSVSGPTADSKCKGFTEVFSPVEAVHGMPPLPGTDLYGLGMTMIYALSGDIEGTRKRSVPESTPEPLCNFIKRLVADDVTERPDWQNENILEAFENMKIKCFGKKSRIKPIPW